MPEAVPDPWLIVQVEAGAWQWFVTTLIAVYAALVATHREVQARRDTKARAVVGLNTAVVGIGPGMNMPAVSLTIANHGRIPLTFSAACCGLHIKGHPETLVIANPIGSPAWPHTLQPGQSLFLVARKDALLGQVTKIAANSPVRIRASYWDQLNRHFYSKWTVFDGHLK